MTRACFVPLALGSFLAALAPLASAQTVRLNGPLARPVGGDVTQFQLNRNGNRVLYRADQERDEVFELFAVKPGVAPYKLNEPLPASADVFDFQLAPDGQRVVYRANPGGRIELFSVPIDGGASIELNPPLPPNGDVLLFQIDPGSQRVLFAVEAFSFDRVELFSAPLDGSAPAVQLNRSEALAGGPSFRVAGTHATFLTRNPSNPSQSSALWGVPIDGSAEPVRLASGRPTYELSTDGKRVLFLDQHLYAIPIDGRGGPIQLSDALIRPTEFRLSADGLRAVYRRGTGDLLSVSTLGDEAPMPLPARVSGSLFQIDPAGKRVLFCDSALRLHSVLVRGGAAPIALSGAGTVNRFEPLADGRVVFVEDPDPTPPNGTPPALELWIARADGLAPAQRLATVTTSFTGLDFVVARSHALYRALTGTQRLELFSVPLDGSAAPVLVSDALVDEREVRVPFTASFNGRHVAYLADRDQDELYELFHAPVDASRAPIKVNPPLVTGLVEGDVVDARFSRDGARAVYLADEREDEVYELFGAPLGSGVAPVRLSGDLAAGGDVQGFELAVAHVVYLADQDVNDRAELYSVPLGGGLAVRLNGSVSASIRSFQLTPDGAQVVYQADEDGDLALELRRVPADGSAPSVALTSSGFPVSATLAPTSDRVVYTADPAGDGTFELYSVDLSGGAPVLLSPIVSVLRKLSITPDGLRMLYSDGSLFSVPIDGSAAPLDLLAGLPLAPTVPDFELGPDGMNVVCSADAFVDRVFELFVAPVDGSAPALRLNTASAVAPAFTPDGARVVFLAQSGAGGLHSVPSDASAPPIVLSTGSQFETPTVITPFLVDAESRRVVFRTATSNGLYELRSVPVDGSAAPLVISRPNSANAVVRDDFRFAPDGRTVLYRVGNGPLVSGSELFHVPASGSREPTRINLRKTGLAETVHGFEVSPDGRLVLHRTIQDSPGVIELYATRFAQAPRVERR